LHSRQRRVQGTTSRRALETGCLQTTHTPYVPCSIRASVLLRDDHLFGASGSEAPLPHRHWGLINHISLQAPGGPAPGTEPRLGQPTTHRASPAAVDCIGVNSDGPTAVLCERKPSLAYAPGFYTLRTPCAYARPHSRATFSSRPEHGLSMLE
jgi:hypothetical protein